MSYQVFKLARGVLPHLVLELKKLINLLTAELIEHVEGVRGIVAVEEDVALDALRIDDLLDKKHRVRAPWNEVAGVALFPIDSLPT